MNDSSKILFIEDGMQYLLRIEDKKLSIQEVIAIINKMVPYKE